MQLSTVGQTGNLSVPLHLRNAPTKLMEKMGYGANYKYAHDYEGNFVDQDFLPKELRGRKFYNPQQNPQEAMFNQVIYHESILRRRRQGVHSETDRNGRRRAG